MVNQAQVLHIALCMRSAAFLLPSMMIWTDAAHRRRPRTAMTIMHKLECPFVCLLDFLFSVVFSLFCSLIRHLQRALGSFLSDVGLVLCQRRSKVGRLLSLTETQADLCFAPRLFVRHANHEIPRRVHHILHVMAHRFVLRYNVDGAQREQFTLASRPVILRVGEDEQQLISSPFNPQRNALQRLCQWPIFGFERGLRLGRQPVHEHFRDTEQLGAQHLDLVVVIVQQSQVVVCHIHFCFESSRV
mmetsp:Transcript_24418/g.68593  ORF Transcript_24418/g.68593 Transcript_24418/m.68593 type:complete len:245 (+) Transcript_24418:217-951(+)